MTTQVNEKYVLTEEEKQQRKAIDFLKGCIVGYNVSHGQKHYSCYYGKMPLEKRIDFSKGLKFSTPEVDITLSYDYNDQFDRSGKCWYGTRLKLHKKSDNWVTICHIIHNRLRHNRPHTGSYESDQKLLTDFREERYYNQAPVRAFIVKLAEYGVMVPGLGEEK
jgi:hypothetical protein